MLILGKHDNSLDNFCFYIHEKSTLENLYIERDYRDLVNKSLDIRCLLRDNLLEFTP